MQGFHSPVLVLCGVFGLVAASAGLRLVLLAFRTHGLPEALLGTSLLCLTVLGIPVIGLSGMGRETVGDVNTAVLALGMGFLWLGVTSLLSFTWKIFRPGVVWAEALVLVVSACFAVGVGMMVGVLVHAPAEARSFDVAHLWSGLLRVPVLIAFVWSAAEALRQYGMARRRLALGITDAVVVNRFLLWGGVACINTVLLLIGLTLHSLGMGMMVSSAGLLVVGSGGFLASVFLYLAFMPPQAYMRFIRRRAIATA